jgi:hypothetical protein
MPGSQAPRAGAWSRSVDPHADSAPMPKSITASQLALRSSLREAAI